MQPLPTRPLDPADAARIEAEWGVPAAELPPVQVCPPRKMTEVQDGWRNLKEAAWRRGQRAIKFQRLAEREGTA